MMSWNILAQVMEVSIWCNLAAGDHTIADTLYVLCLIAVSPCWNIKNTRIGSFQVNDPMVKVTFFRVTIIS